jgi:hypothetical protein
MKATHVRTVRGKLARALLMTLAVPALMLGAVSPALADPGTSGDDPCTTGTFSGTTYNGSWTRNYNPSCANNTTASVTISWSNYTASNGDHHITWDASLTVGPIFGTKCVEIALDWHNSAFNQHSDAQYMRNCKESSTRNMPTQDIDTQSYSAGNSWPVQRLQMAVYDPSTGDRTNEVCPGASGAPALTADDAGCKDWLHLGAASWSSLAAKIYRRTNAGTDQQNSPLYPDHYGVWEQADAGT